MSIGPFPKGHEGSLYECTPPPPPQLLPPSLLSSHSLCCHVMLLAIRRKEHCMMTHRMAVWEITPANLEIPGFLLHHDPLPIGISSSVGWIWISFETTHSQHQFKTPSP